MDRQLLIFQDTTPEILLAGKYIDTYLFEVFSISYISPYIVIDVPPIGFNIRTQT